MPLLSPLAVTLPNPLDFIEPGAYLLLILTYMALVTAFVKGYIVPRFIYDKETTRADKATEALNAFSRVVEAHTSTFQKALDDITDELKEWRRGRG